jgi:hypothetical protein
VPALARGDVERLLRFVSAATSGPARQPFTPDVLVELGRLVLADLVTFLAVEGDGPVVVTRPGESDEELGIATSSSRISDGSTPRVWRGVARSRRRAA